MPQALQLLVQEYDAEDLLPKRGIIVSRATNALHSRFRCASRRRIDILFRPGAAPTVSAGLSGSVRPSTSVLTTLILVLAGDHPGNEIQSPMAEVILGGLISSTLLNLVVVPVLFLRYGER